MSWFTISSLSGKRLCSAQHSQQASSWHSGLGCGQTIKQDFISPDQTVIQLHQRLSVSVVGAFVLAGSDLIGSRVRSRAGSVAQRWLWSAGPWPGEVSSGLPPAASCGATAPAVKKQRAKPHGDLGRKCFPWGWRDQQLWVCRLDVLEHRWLPDQASCWLLWADGGTPCSRFLKNSQRATFLLFSLSQHRMETCWNLRKGSENRKQFPTHF